MTAELAAGVEPAGWAVPPGAEDEEDAAEAELERDDIGRPRVPSWVDDAEPEDLALAAEAVCFVLNRAVTIGELSAILGRSSRAAELAVEVLAYQLRGRGLMLQRHLDQVQLVTRPQVAWAAQRALNPERPARLSRPALETLAIVAYRQPVSRARVEQIRGVSCEAVLDGLERRGLISETGRAESPGHPRLFGTTLRFLQLVGLERIEQLPPLADGLALPAEQRQAWAEAFQGGSPAPGPVPGAPAGEPSPSDGGAAPAGAETALPGAAVAGGSAQAGSGTPREAPGAP